MDPLSLTEGDCGRRFHKWSDPASEFPCFCDDRGIEWGKMSAAGSVLIVPLTVLFYSIQQFLIRGLSFGALAG
jgi:ABC-type glycerol-3-phosphate transport system permease component